MPPDLTSRPISPSLLERFVVWYARTVRLNSGKLRLVDSLWRVASRGRGYDRTASLAYGGFKAPCDIQQRIQRQLYFFGTYYAERHLIEHWRRLARCAPVIFDVGANAGIYSLAALAANPEAIVHAFEPTPEIAARLRATAHINGLARLHVHQLAVVESPGQVALVRCGGESDGNDGMNYVISKADQRFSEPVPATSLDSFCVAFNIERIDLLKIDIQGNESLALKGAERLLRTERIGTIFMELTWGQDASTCGATWCVNTLEQSGYRFAAPSSRLVWQPAGDWLRSLTDVVASRDYR